MRRSEPPAIAVLLPRREPILARRSGAVALCAIDFLAASRWRERVLLFGGGPNDRDGLAYAQLPFRRRWWRRRTTAYAETAADAALARGVRLIEAQNRPVLIPTLRRRAPGLKLILHLHNDPQTMKGCKTVAERAARLAESDAVVCVSAFVRARFVEGLAGDLDKVVVVHNGLAAPALAAAKEPIVAFAGRMVREKGVVELVRAFARFAPAHPEWRLVLAGDDRDGLLAREARAELSALGARVERLGQVGQDEVMALFARAAVVAAPALWEEPFGRTALEAMAAGCALVTTATGGLAEVVGEAGLIVEARDVDAFAAALGRLAGDAGLRERLQQDGRTRARARFDLAACAARLDELRDRLLGPG